jgi:flagella synthesis protein FlgN
MYDTTLLKLFNDDIDTARQLLELTDAEFQALGARDLPLLEKILTDKMPLVALLKQHGSERGAILVGLKLSADRNGLKTLAGQYAQGEELLSKGDELGALLEQCRDANLRNGRLIRASQVSVSNVLGILRGGETPSTYDSRGGAIKIAQQRPLSQA